MNRVFHHEGATSSWRSTGALLVLAYAIVVGGLVVANVVHGPLRTVLTAPLLGFLPGYALLDALFPTRAPTTGAESGDRGHDGLAWGARAALAVGLSVVVVVILVVAVGSLGVPLTTAPLTAALVLLVTAGIAVGSFRRLRHGTGEEYGLPIGRWRAEIRAATIDANSGLDAALAIALAVTIVLAMTGFAFALAAPDRGASYSEVALLTGQGDELVAGGYPETVAQGEPVDLTLTIENQEGVETTYTVHVVLERVRTTDDAVQVVERESLDRRTVTVADGETARESLSLEPTMLGDDLRLNVLVVEGDASERVDPSTADHQLYLWLDVRQNAASADMAAADATSKRDSASVVLP